MEVLFNEFKCDWYSGTFFAEDKIPLSDSVDFQLNFISRFLSDLSFIYSEFGVLSFDYLSKGMHGYNSQVVIYLSSSFDSDKVRIGTVLYNGSTSGMSVHFFLTSSYANTFKQFLDRLFGGIDSHLRIFKYLMDHKCTRCDIAYDMLFSSSDDVNAFYSDLRSWFVSKNIKTALAGDWDYCKHGRTYYGGASSSDVRFCIYEKGIEQIRQGNIEDTPINRLWVRIELRVKGRRGMQFAIPSSSLMTIANATSFTRKFYDDFLPELSVSSYSKLIKLSTFVKELPDRVIGLFSRSKKLMHEFFHDFCQGNRDFFIDSLFRFMSDGAFNDYSSIDDFYLFLNYNRR